MKPLRTAIAVGALSAVITWSCVFGVRHKPASWILPDGSRGFVILCPADAGDLDLTALFWACGAYLLSFTPTLLLLHRPVRGDVFSTGG